MRLDKLINIFKVLKVFLITGKYLFLSWKKQSDIIDLKKRWSKDILSHFNIKLKIKGSPVYSGTPSLFIGNHISYLDIPLLLQGNSQVAFVSKKEVESWPVIGSAAKKMKTIFVERSSRTSRNKAKEKITESLLVNQAQIAIFPSGTTSLLSSSEWRKGVFEIAKYENISIQPFRIRYNPPRKAAFIDDDNLLTHMLELFSLKAMDAFLEFHEPVSINSINDDCEYWKLWAEQADIF
jgi:1-acyl-sn-glycerol-3-phosphate acyltransferase